MEKKQLMKRSDTGRAFLPFLCLLVFFFISESSAFAAGNDSEGYGSFFELVSDFQSNLISLTKVIIFLSAGFSLMMLGWAIMSGERESLKRFGVWTIGLVIGFAVLSFLGRVTPKSDVMNAENFNTLRGSVFSFISILLNIVCIITVAGRVIQIINGEKEGGRQLFKWFVVTVIGFTLLSGVNSMSNIEPPTRVESPSDSGNNTSIGGGDGYSGGGYGGGGR